MEFSEIISDYFEKNRPPSLQERFSKVVEDESLVNELIDIVEGWLPKENPSPNFYTLHWNKCVKGLKDRLRNP